MAVKCPIIKGEKMTNELQTCPFCGNVGGYFINIFKHRKDLVVGCSRKSVFVGLQFMWGLIQSKKR